MKIIFDSKEKTVVKFDKGDECLPLLLQLASGRDTSLCFSMIGGCSLVEVAFFDINEKKYVSKEFVPGFSNNIEVLSMTGNIAYFEGKPVVHAHGVFSDEEYKTFGGHINKIVISITGEVIIDWLSQKIEREYDAEFCLKLLN